MLYFDETKQLKVNLILRSLSKPKQTLIRCKIEFLDFLKYKKLIN